MELQKTRTVKLVLLGIAAAGLLYVYFGTAFLPITHRARAAEIAALEEEQQQLELRLNQARRLAAGLPELEVAHARLTRQWELARELLPDETEIASLLQEVSFRGQESGVEFTLFKPEPLVSRGFYSEKPVEIRIEGGYHQIARCLNGLAQMDRIVHVRDLDIEQILDKSREESEPSARAHFTATAYVLGSAEAAAAAEQSAAGSGLGGAVKRLVAGREGAAPATKASGPARGGSEE